MFLAPRVDQATEPSLFTWAEFLPGSCADPSAVRLLADLPYRMSKQAQNVQTKSSSLGPLKPCGLASVGLSNLPFQKFHPCFSSSYFSLPPGLCFQSLLHLEQDSLLCIINISSIKGNVIILEDPSLTHDPNLSWL